MWSRIADWFIVTFHHYYTFLYVVWSRIWNFFEVCKYVDTKGKYAPLSVFSIKDLDVLMGQMKSLWRKDSGFRLFDCISIPEKLEYARQLVASGGEAPDSNDCDEFGRYSCYSFMALHELTKKGLARDNIFELMMMQVVWRAPDRIHGHHVCLFKSDCGWYHIGNWGLRGPFKDELEAANNVSGQGEGTYLLVASTFNYDTLGGWRYIYRKGR